MGNVLNEFINGIHITDDELERRLGCGRSVLRSLHDHLITSHRSVWPDHGDSSKAQSKISLSLTRTQLETMSRALRNLASGADIEAWEFPIRLGQGPNNALKLASELDTVVESLSPQ
jgi:hypothetical protein